MATPTPVEYLAIGRLQGSVAIVAKSAGPLVALVGCPAMDDGEWRAKVVAACRPIRLAADQGRGVHGLSHHPTWRPVVAALERVATCAVVAEHAVMHGDEAGLILMVRHRLPRVLLELNAALSALLAAMARPEVSPVAYAC